MKNKKDKRPRKAYKFRLYLNNEAEQKKNSLMLLAHNLYNLALQKSIEEFVSPQLLSQFKESAEKKYPYNIAKQKKEIREQIGKEARANYLKVCEIVAWGKKDDTNKIAIGHIINDIVANDERFQKLHSQTIQNVRDRLINSYNRFLGRGEYKNLKGRKLGGFPRFKSRDRYNSITYPQNAGAFKLIQGNRLKVSGIGIMEIVMHRKIGGDFKRDVKALTIVQEAGNTYAVFSVANNDFKTPMIDLKEKSFDDIKILGADMGIKPENFLALSNGEFIRKPKFARLKERKLSHWQRVVAGKQLGSMNRRKARKHLQRAWMDINNQTTNFSHQENLKMANSGYDVFAFEDMDISNMMHNHHTARSFAGAALGGFRDANKIKVNSFGKLHLREKTKDSTQECSGCHNIKKGKDHLTPKDRVYHCYVCGLVMDRDTNSAKVIGYRARMTLAKMLNITAGLAGINALGDEGSAITQRKLDDLQPTSMNRELSGQIPCLQLELGKEEAHTL